MTSLYEDFEFEEDNPGKSNTDYPPGGGFRVKGTKVVLLALCARESIAVPASFKKAKGGRAKALLASSMDTAFASVIRKDTKNTKTPKTQKHKRGFEVYRVKKSKIVKTLGLFDQKFENTRNKALEIKILRRGATEGKGVRGDGVRDGKEPDRLVGAAGAAQEGA